MTHLPTRLSVAEGQPAILNWEKALVAETYNVYRNGERIAEGLTEATYTDEVPSETTYCIYTVTGVVNGVESSPSNKAYWGNVGVAENSTQSVLIYPNPASGQVTIESAANCHISILNALGQKMMEMESDGNATIDLSPWQNGVYFIETTTGNHTDIQKIIKL